MMNQEENNNSQELTLLAWFLRAYPETPRTRAKQFILAGRISVNDCVIRRPQQLLPDPGSGLKLLGKHAMSVDCGRGWPIHPRVTLLHIDSSLGVLNKGPGLISVPAGEQLSALGILKDFVCGKLRSRDPSGVVKSIPPGFRRLDPRPVHRLDQYTSGLFCLAFNEEARANLIDQLRRGEIRREYVAFVEGRPKNKSGTWRTWLELMGEEGRQTVAAVQSKGHKSSEAITHFQVEAEYEAPCGAVFAKLRLQLETGLKHQIRIQAARAGLPLIGDRTYNPNYRPGASSPLFPFDRQALHAENLALNHPKAPHQRLSWRAELPEDLASLERMLRRLSPRPPQS